MLKSQAQKHSLRGLRDHWKLGYLGGDRWPDERLIAKESRLVAGEVMFASQVRKLWAVRSSFSSLRPRATLRRADICPVDIRVIPQEARNQVLGDDLGIVSVLGRVLRAKRVDLGQNVDGLNRVRRRVRLAYRLSPVHNLAP